MNKERKIYNHKSIILKDRTIEEYGYDPESLGKTSTKFVIAICRFCGKEHKIRKGFFNKSGSACHRECKLKEQGEMSPMKSPQKREYALSKLKEKYGSKYASQNKEIAKKISNMKKKEIKKKEMKNEESFECDVFALLDGKQVPANQKSVKSKTKAIPSQPSNVVPDKILLAKECTKAIDTEIISLIKDLKNLGLNPERNNKTAVPGYILDIYIPDSKAAICFNGSYFSSECYLGNDVVRKNQYKKTQACEKAGIKLLHIFEHQWHERKSQIMSFMKSMLGVNSRKIPARKCEISNDSSKEFLKTHHIQGYGFGTLKHFNLVYNGEILGSMTAGKHHEKGGDFSACILNRLAFKEDVTVQGGASKMFKQFAEWAKSEGYKKIISWSDTSISYGNVYHQLGFVLTEEHQPNYFYFDIKNNRYCSRQSRRPYNKHRPKSITIGQWNNQDGLFRIWDCGKRTFVYNLD